MWGYFNGFVTGLRWAVPAAASGSSVRDLAPSVFPNLRYLSVTPARQGAPGRLAVAGAADVELVERPERGARSDRSPRLQPRGHRPPDPRHRGPRVRVAGLLPRVRRRAAHDRLRGLRRALRGHHPRDPAPCRDRGGRGGAIAAPTQAAAVGRPLAALGGPLPLRVGPARRTHSRTIRRVWIDPPDSDAVLVLGPRRRLGHALALHGRVRRGDRPAGRRHAALRVPLHAGGAAVRPTGPRCCVDAWNEAFAEGVERAGGRPVLRRRQVDGRADRVDGRGRGHGRRRARLPRLSAAPARPAGQDPRRAPRRRAGADALPAGLARHVRPAGPARGA